MGRTACLCGRLAVTPGMTVNSIERLSFGVEPTGRDEQTITEAYIAPVHRAAAHVRATAAMTPTESGSSAHKIRGRYYPRHAKHGVGSPGARAK
jgi:hypothetical protein